MGGRVNGKTTLNPSKVCKFMSLSSQQVRRGFAVRRVTVWLAALWGMGCLLLVRADPWLAPGDATLRHDLQWLADEGVFTAPTTTWPLARD